jgi:DNA-directed RNA polymerase subunit RPC12/RpoP
MDEIAAAAFVGAGYLARDMGRLEEHQVGAHLVYFCVRCWRAYFAGGLSQSQVERTIFSAHRSGTKSKPTWRCVQCAETVEAYRPMHGTPEAPSLVEPQDEMF